MRWYVDRFEGRLAVLVSDDGKVMNLARGSFRVGQIYQLRGRLLHRDLPAEKRMRAELARLEAWRKAQAAKDTGGNIQL